MADFLGQVERRAFKHAQFATHDTQAALDIVQDAMLKLSEKYSQRPLEELPMLFQRILQNTIKDFFRRLKVRTLWTTPISSLILHNGESDDLQDPLESFSAEESNALSNDSPDKHLERSKLIEKIEECLKKLPARQREAFLLRYWEELDVSAAAKAMGCSEGSVKTHCSRATHWLAEELKKEGITL